MKIIGHGQLTALLESNSFNTGGVTSTDQLKELLHERYPALSGIPYTIAVNNKIIHENNSLHHGDTVSLLPPFSGG